MNLIITRNFPPDVGGMQNLMFGLTKSLSEHMNNLDQPRCVSNI